MSAERDAAPDADDVRLEGLLRERLGDSSLALARRREDCISRVYRATTSGGRALFVKWGFADAACAAELLRRNPGNPLLPERVVSEEMRLDGRPVYVFAWSDARHIPVEEMSDAQFESFIAACDSLSGVLNEPGMAEYMRRWTAEGVRRDPDVRGPAVDPLDCLETVRSYVALHPAARPLLAPLLAMRPEDLRRPADAELRVVHGDLHPGNFGFDGDRVAAFFDFDNLAFAYPIEDFARVFAESAKKSGLFLHPLLRRRLFARFRDIAASRGTPGQWRFAVSRLRLYYARNSLRRRMSGLRVAFNVAMRDRRIARLERHLPA